MADTFIAGGAGTMADAANNNGGGYVAGGTADYSDCQGANGGPTSAAWAWDTTQTANIVTNNGGFGNIRITETLPNAFVNCIAGSIAYVEFAGVEYADDWYEVLSVNTVTGYIVIDLLYGVADDTCDCKVGGAFAADGTGFATGIGLFAAASGDELQVATDVTSATVYAVAAEITTPAVAGTAAAPFRIYGVDHTDGSELTVDDERPIMQATAVITSILSWVAAFDYCNVESIEWDGNTDKANYCWHFGDADYSNYHTIKHCRFHHAISHGVYSEYQSNFCMYFDNEVDNNGGIGWYSKNYYSIFSANKIHHNASHGFYSFFLQDSSFCFNNVYTNGSGGIRLYYAKTSLIENNTVYNNSEDGFNIIQNSASYGQSVAIINNTIFSNGGYGINNSDIGALRWPKDLMQLSNNHSWDNTNGHCRECPDDNDWPEFMDGAYSPDSRNITGDPEMVDPANADFTPKFSSPLIGAGVNKTTIGAVGRLEGWGIGGGSNGGFN